MDCERANRDNIVERYLAGTLDAQTTDEWEQHLFACDLCTQQLELCQTITPVLREMAPQIRREMRPSPARRWLWIAAPVAAMALLLVFANINKGPKTPAPIASKTGDFTYLAKLEPPAYNAPTLRGVESPAQGKFREAMTFYQSRDWSHAIDGLNTSLGLDPNAPAPRFFLGASYLMAGNPRQGVAELERVAKMDSPFADEARFDLAKGYLALGWPDLAITTLRTCGGDFATLAPQLISAIQTAQK
jgi:hypothetical protein